MKINGITLIRNGNKLKYPWMATLKQLFSLCDDVYINIDPADPTDYADLMDFRSTIPSDQNLYIYTSKWNMSNTGDGRELAIQVNKLLRYLPQNTWTVYCQADEMIHEEDAPKLRTLINSLPKNITQIELYRTYFWESIYTRNPEFEIWLGRIFLSGTHTVGGDGMYLNRLSGDVFRSEFNLYHYSRIGKPEDVTARIRTLDTLFHNQETVDMLEPFSYNMNKEKLFNFTGSHPKEALLFYDK